MSTLTNQPPSIPEGLVRVAVAAYATPPRAYHSFAHVQAVFRHFDLVTTEGPGWQHPTEVWLAILFHDAVYESSKSDNEARSADLAERAISEFMPRGVDLARVRRLIELTARHGKLKRDELEPDEQLFLDSDMAILGADAPAFDAYDAGIAEEYAQVPKILFRFNRRRFLKKLLESERIYFSEFFHQRLDAQARVNLARSLSRDE